MLTAVAFCPASPLLLPRVSRASDVELDAVRAAALRATRSLVDSGVSEIVVLSAGERRATIDGDPVVTPSTAPWGIPDLAESPVTATTLSPTESIGHWLLSGAGWAGATTWSTLGATDTRPFAAADARGSMAEGDGSVGLLVLADGSTTRSAKAPRSFHPDSEAFDTDLGRALAEGDPAALAKLDEGRSAAVHADDTRVWRSAGHLCAARGWQAELLDARAPYGVGYFSAIWT